LIAMITPSASSARRPCEGPAATRLVTGLEGAMGSTIGPDGALYVTEGAAGRISRVDPQTGEKTTFASGMPTAMLTIGGLSIGGPIRSEERRVGKEGRDRSSTDDAAQEETRW